jgi:amidase
VSAELAYTSATEIAARIRLRDLSAVEVMDTFLARIEARDRSLNAFVFRAFDEARERARAADRAVSSGAALGLLHGVPTAMKDLFDFHPGWPSTYGGIPALRDNVVDFCSVWAERMEAAGAIIVGKTNSPVMGFRGTTDNPLFGPTRNPFDTTRNPGGSSGGSAAAVADGLLPFAEGTDGGGSVRIPAAWCGVYGYKQSFGRVPLAPRPNAFGGIDPFIFEGLLVRTVEDAALGLSVLQGYDPRDPFALDERIDALAAVRRSIEGWRIAYSPDLGGIPVDPVVAELVADAVRAFEAAGARVEEVEIDMPADQRELSDLWCRLIMPLNLEAIEGLAAGGVDLLGEHRDQLPAEYLRWIDHGLGMSAMDVIHDQQLRTRVYDAVQAVLADHELLVTPTLAVLPVPNADNGNTKGPAEVNGTPVDELIGWCLTYAVNFTGHPAASIPTGLSDGLPVGMQLIGRRYADADVLAASAAYERVRPWRDAYRRCQERPL